MKKTIFFKGRMREKECMKKTEQESSKKYEESEVSILSWKLKEQIRNNEEAINKCYR